MLAATWKCGSRTFDLSRPLVMGICNVTPDSFSDGGDHDSFDEAVAYALKMVEEGADIIDVGGESARPGSAEVSVEEETRRVVPVISALAGRGIAVSVDTRHAPVARAALDAGACIINDISGFRDEAMREVAQGSDAGLVIMHMLGTPEHMQDDPHYDDVVSEVEDSLVRMARRLEAQGVERDRICLDPGVCFGKLAEHNAALLLATERFANAGYPFMVAVSRKSFIGLRSGLDVPKERDLASALCAAAACADGARVARVHNVALTREVLATSRRALVALGSNQANPVEQLDDALEALRKTQGVWVSRVSTYVTSEPAYLAEQDEFVNAVAQVQTTLGPRKLLDALHAIEDSQGRVRETPNGPRTIDLDIVDYEGIESSQDELVLPHPRALERDFVVTPLLEIAPGYVLADGTPVTRANVTVGKVTGQASFLSLS